MCNLYLRPTTVISELISANSTTHPSHLENFISLQKLQIVDRELHQRRDITDHRSQREPPRQRQAAGECSLGA